MNTGSAKQTLRLGSRPALTGLRALAVMLVLLHHFDVLLLKQNDGRAGVIMPGGFIGVDIFFVLSGFLITTLLLERSERAGRVNLMYFWRDRLYRLLPALAVVTVLIGVAYTKISDASLGEAAYTFLMVLFYGANWAAVAGQDVFAPLGHTWSLAVEGQFYLIWPIVILVATRRRISPRAAMILIAVGILAVWAWRAILWSQVGIYNQVFPRTDVRADTLLLGALVSIAWRNGYVSAAKARLFAIPALLVIGLGCFVLELNESLVYYIGYSVVGLASAVLILSLLEQDWWLGAALSRRPAVYVGNISYSLYLWHFPVLFVVAGAVDGWAGGAVAMVGSFAAAAVSYRFVEQPFLRLKKRLHPAEARRPQQAVLN